MIQHVYERAREAKSVDHVVIATDDTRILNAAQAFGADARMTSPDHRSGTDRAAEAAAAFPHEVVVNIQGDEPMIDPASIDACVAGLTDGAPMSTLKTRMTDPAEIANPNAVKVVTDRDGNAIYFSRHAIPFDREGSAVWFKHLGLYVYQREFLLGYSRLPVGPLEIAERLEQLRALENGFRIRVVETGHDSIGVDTPEDLVNLEKQMALENKRAGC